MRADNAAELGGDRRNVDQPAPTALAHPPDDALRHEKRGREIDSEEVVPVVFGNGVDRLRARDPRVVDQDIDARQVPLHGRHETIDFGCVRHVGADRQGAPPARFDGRAREARLILSYAKRQGDVRAGAGECLGDGPADPAVAARDERDPAGELAGRVGRHRSVSAARLVGQELQTEGFFDVLEIATFVRIGQCQRVPGFLVAPGTADPMNVAVEPPRHFVVHD
jgi:hypothetical protein